MADTRNLKTILIISADSQLLADIGQELCLPGYQIRIARSHTEALNLLEKLAVAVIFLDLQTPPAQEMDIVSYIKTRSPETEIIILTTINELDAATHALRSGAALYLLKPVACSDLTSVLEKVALKIDRDKEHVELEHRILTDLMGDNPTMQKMLKLALKIAPTTSTVLIGGESGTGKEFFARIIHRMSPRLNGRFVAVNCGAIPDTLFESELFGHRKGAFTGADRDKPGLVEEAHMGTLFLDEVGELSPAAQVKLLRFLQERTFRRIGETTQRNVNVRIIAASNKDLSALVARGTFREDLFYRLNIFYLHLPPLRERKETIPNLVRLFVHKNNTLLNKNINRFSKGAEVIIANYDYPGNVRELENIIEHAVVLADGNEVTEKDLPEFMFRNRLLLKGPDLTLKGIEGPAVHGEIATLAEVEKRHIETALARLNNNYSETAKKLGISRSTLWRKLKTYGLDNGEPAPDEE
jgi:DNA-binding NtrC family response regulator